MSEWTSEWPSTYVSILVCSRPQCSGGFWRLLEVGVLSLTHTRHTFLTRGNYDRLWWPTMGESGRYLDYELLKISVGPGFACYFSTHHFVTTNLRSSCCCLRLSVHPHSWLSSVQRLTSNDQYRYRYRYRYHDFWGWSNNYSNTTMTTTKETTSITTTKMSTATMYFLNRALQSKLQPSLTLYGCLCLIWV